MKEKPAVIEIEQEAPPQPERKRPVEWATEGGYLPEFTQVKSKIRPVVVNQKTWLYTAAKNRAGWTDETLITKADFDALIADLGSALVR
jgi:hypothetical protein